MSTSEDLRSWREHNHHPEQISSYTPLEEQWFHSRLCKAKYTKSPDERFLEIIKKAASYKFSEARPGDVDYPNHRYIKPPTHILEFEYEGGVIQIPLVQHKKRWLMVSMLPKDAENMSSYLSEQKAGAAGKPYQSCFE